jgi:hypothetical protein
VLDVVSNASPRELVVPAEPLSMSVTVRDALTGKASPFDLGAYKT